MAEGKKSAIVYGDLIHTVRKLKKEDAGELFLHFLEYINDLHPTTDNIIVEVAFEPIKQQLKRDLKKWESISERRSLAGKASADKRNKDKQTATNSTSVDFVQQTSTNPTVNDNGNVNVNGNVNDNVISKDIKEKEPDPLPTSRVFCLENEEIFDFLISEQQWKETVCMQNKITIGQLETYIKSFSELLKFRGETSKTPKSAKSHFANWFKLEKQKSNGNTKSDRRIVQEVGSHSLETM